MNNENENTITKGRLFSEHKKLFTIEYLGKKTKNPLKKENTSRKEYKRKKNLYNLQNIDNNGIKTIQTKINFENNKIGIINLNKEISKIPISKVFNESPYKLNNPIMNNCSNNLNINCNKNINNNFIDLPTTGSEISSMMSLNLQKKNKFAGEYIYFEDKKIGEGSYGEVLYGRHKNQLYEVAVKIQNNKGNVNSMKKEIDYTKKLENDEGFPKVYFSNVQSTKTIIVESLLGPSLDKLYKLCDKKFCLKTVCLIGIEITKRLESMHKKGLLHRDLKPNNFAWGSFRNISSNILQDKKVIYLFDFGLSCSFYESGTKKHYRYDSGFEFIGTLRYASINSHLGIQQSRRDDLESLLYILIYFLKGSLPWQGVKAKSKEERKEKIKNEKKNTSIDILCEGIHPTMKCVLEDIKNLHFEEEPNYYKIKYYFETIIKNIQNPEEAPYNFIWEKKMIEKLNNTTKSNNNQFINDISKSVFEGYPVKVKKFIENLIPVNDISNIISN